MDWRLRNAAVLHSAMDDLLDDLRDNLIGRSSRLLVAQDSTKPEIIEESLDQLFRFSRAVRRSGILHRFVKIANYVDHSPEGVNLTEQFRNAATQLVDHHLRNSPAPPSLRDRLIETICLRQQNFSYLKSRRPRKPLSPLVNETTPSAPRSVLTTSFSIGGSVPAAPKRKASMTIRTAKRAEHSVMTATTVQYNSANVEYSVQPSVNSQDSEITDCDENLPQPPAVPVGQREWECPYCLLVCPAKELSGEAWRKHILGDVMPYICILDTCPTSKTLFKSSKDWIHHMKQEHVSSGSWTCMDSTHNTPCLFRSEPEFREHMRCFHEGQFDDSDLEDLVEACFESKPSNLTLSGCPFCTENAQPSLATDDLFSHVARHLLSFARISLEGYVEESVGASDVASVSDEMDRSQNPIMAMTVKEGLEMHIDVFTGDGDDDSESLAALSALGIPQETEDESWEFYRRGKEISHDPVTDPILRNLTRKTENLHWHDVSKGADWVSFYNVPPEVMEHLPQKEIIRQEMMQEIVFTEIRYLDQLTVVRALYRDQLVNAQPPIVPPKRMKDFVKQGFDRIDLIEAINRELLFKRLTDRQREQGPFIVGFGDIFCDWANRARQVYMDYSAAYPYINYIFRDEAVSNPRFDEFLRQVREHKRSNRLAWDTYFKKPIERVSHYIQILRAVHRKTDKGNEDMQNLTLAINQLELLQVRCGEAFVKAQKKIDMTEMSSKLLIPHAIKMKTRFDVLDPSREIIFQGSLRMRDTSPSLGRLAKEAVRPTKKSWIDMHVVLFYSHLVLTELKPAMNPTRRFSFLVKSAPIGVQKNAYEVSKVPIPMHLLALELDAENGKFSSTPWAPKHKDSEYPISVRHLETTNSCVLYAASQQDQETWKRKIIEAKTKHAALLVSLNKEPFRLNVLSRSVFQYSSRQPGANLAVIPGTPLDRAMKEANTKALQSTSFHPTRYITDVNCFITIFKKDIRHRLFIVGTNDGASFFGPEFAFRKNQILPGRRITQIHAFEKAEILILLADDKIFEYELHGLGSLYQELPAEHDKEIAPFKISGENRVRSLITGHHYGEPILIFQTESDQRPALNMIRLAGSHASVSSNLSVEPPSQLWLQKHSQLSYDDLTASAVALKISEVDCTNIHIDNMDSSLVLMTPQKIERAGIPPSGSYQNSEPARLWPIDIFPLRTILDRKDSFPLGVDELSVRQMLNQNDSRPVRTFILTDTQSCLAGNHYLAVYESFALHLKPDFELSSTPLIWFLGKVKKACLVDRFLILFHQQYVEIRDVVSGELNQVIPGRGIRCLSADSHSYRREDLGSFGDFGVRKMRSSQSESGDNQEKTVKMAMQHPENADLQIILELARVPEAHKID